VLNRASLDLGGLGVQASALLHDCVPTTFYALASVLPTLKTHHYCSWHSITRFSEYLPKVYSDAEDLVETGLIAAVRDKKITLPQALLRQREAVLHSFNAILLARHEDDAAVFLAGFHRKYCVVNTKLVKLLSRDPYNDLSAMLLCWSSGARAIDAECELFARAVRAFQCTAQGGRIKMRNFAGALLLVVHALFYSARSEYRERLRASRSLGARAPLALLPPVFPALAVAGGGSFTQQQQLLKHAPACAYVSTLAPNQLHKIRAADVSGSLQTMAQRLPTHDYGWRLRLAAHCATSGAFTFATLHRILLLNPTSIISQEVLDSFAEALQAASSRSQGALHAKAHACVTPLEVEEDECAPSFSSHEPPAHPFAASTSSTSIATAAARLFAVQTFGSIRAPAVQPPRPLSAQLYSMGILPPLAAHRGCGRSHDPQRLQWATVTGHGDACVGISLANQLRILHALRDLPKAVKVHYLVPQQLCERGAGVGHSSGKECAALSAPKKRALCALTLIASAMANLYGVPHWQGEGSSV